MHSNLVRAASEDLHFARGSRARTVPCTREAAVRVLAGRVVHAFIRIRDSSGRRDRRRARRCTSRSMRPRTSASYTLVDTLAGLQHVRERRCAPHRSWRPTARRSCTDRGDAPAWAACFPSKRRCSSCSKRAALVNAHGVDHGPRRLVQRHEVVLVLDQHDDGRRQPAPVPRPAARCENHHDVSGAHALSRRLALRLHR